MLVYVANACVDENCDVMLVWLMSCIVVIVSMLSISWSWELCLLSDVVICFLMLVMFTSTMWSSRMRSWVIFLWIRFVGDLGWIECSSVIVDFVVSVNFALFGIRSRNSACNWFAMRTRCVVRFVCCFFNNANIVVWFLVVMVVVLLCSAVMLVVVAVLMILVLWWLFRDSFWIWVVVVEGMFNMILFWVMSYCVRWWLRFCVFLMVYCWLGNCLV